MGLRPCLPLQPRSTPTKACLGRWSSLSCRLCCLDSRHGPTSMCLYLGFHTASILGGGGRLGTESMPLSSPSQRASQPPTDWAPSASTVVPPLTPAAACAQLWLPGFNSLSERHALWPWMGPTPLPTSIGRLWRGGEWSWCEIYRDKGTVVFW
jgi:hypothetical protein